MNRPSLQRGRRGSSQISNISDTAGLILSPSMLQIENNNYASGLQTCQNSIAGRADSNLRKSGGSHKGIVGGPTELTKQDSSYGNIVQTKAQHDARNPGLVYVRKSSQVELIAKQSATNSKKHQMRQNSQSKDRADPSKGSGSGLGQQRRPGSKTQHSQNTDIAHMQVTGDQNLTGNGIGKDKQYPNQYGSETFSNEPVIIKNSSMIVKNKNSSSKLQNQQRKANQSRSKNGSRPAYARFRLQEHIKSLARPKNAPICGPRLRELSNVVFEQQVAQQYSESLTTKNQANNLNNNESLLAQNNENFAGPHHMARNFRSHKVGEAPDQLTNSVNHRPYYQGSVTMPKSYRPQSHYNRETQLQLNTEHIIGLATANSQSTRQLIRPASTRAGTGAFRINEMNTVVPQCLTIEISGNGQGMATATTSAYDYGMHQTLSSYARNSLTVKNNTATNMIMPRQSQQQPMNSTFASLTTSKGNLNQRQNGSRPLSGSISRTQKAQLNLSGATSKKRLNNSLALQMRIKPQLQITGDELIIQKTTLHQIQAKETDKEADIMVQQRHIENVLLNQEVQRDNLEDNGRTTQVKGDLLQTQVSRNFMQPGDGHSTPAPTSQHPKGTQFLMNESVNITPTKNVTVFDKLATQTQDISEEKILAHQQLIASQLAQSQVGNNLIKYDDKLINLKVIQHRSIDQPSIGHMDSKDCTGSRGEETQDFLLTAKNYEDTMNQIKINNVSPSSLIGNTQPLSTTNAAAQQYNTRLNLAQMLDEKIPGNELRNNIQDLKSLSSAEERLTNLNSNSQREQKFSQQCTPLQLNKFGLQSSDQAQSRTRLGQIRSEVRRGEKVGSQSRERSNHRNHSNSSKSHCKRCMDQEIESTKKRIDKNYQITSKSKVYFKPSVVEIHDENLAKLSQSPRTNNRNVRNGIHQNYLLGPNLSQENMNLGAIREEQSQAGFRSSMSSTAMQALFGSEDGPNFGDIAANPETREFILYLQQVQPDLLVQQYQSQSNIKNPYTAPLTTDQTVKKPFRRSSTIEDPNLGTLPIGTLRLSNATHIAHSKQNNHTLTRPEQLTAIRRNPDFLQDEVLTAYKGGETTPIDQATIVEEQPFEENQIMSSVGDAIETERNKITSTERSKQVICSQETLAANGQISAREDITMNFATSPDKIKEKSVIVDIPTQQVEKAKKTASADTANDEIPVRDQDMLPADTEQHTMFNDDPVNYAGQIDMMHEIFKQISDQRANASRTTVKNQKVIFQPTVREFRKLDYKPVTNDDRRYPPTIDSMAPIPRPKSKSKKPIMHRNAQRRQAQSLSTHIEKEESKLKLNRTQVGTQGKFASLLNRKRADKMVTWGIEPPKSNTTKSFADQQQSGRNQSSYYSYGAQTTGNSYYYEQAQDNDGVYHDYPDQYNQVQYMQPHYQQYQNLIDPSARNSQISKPQMSAIREVSSVSHKDDTTSSHPNNLSHHTAKTQVTHKSSNGQSQYAELDNDVRDLMHEMVKAKTSQHGTLETKKSQLDKTNKTTSNDESGRQTTNKTKMTHITGWTGRDTAHRRGEPMGCETWVNTSQESGSGFMVTVQEEGDDTFAALFYDKEQAAANKFGGKGGDEAIEDKEPDTMEWSQRASKPLQKFDEYGHALSHKGNVITRGFNPGQQRNLRIVATNDPQLLKNERLKHIFDDKKHRITNYINCMGPPTKKSADLSRQQWKRIKRAQFSYDNLEEKKKVRKPTSQKQKINKDEEEKLDDRRLPSVQADKPGEEHKQIIEGDIFSFSNPERYKTDQLKEQALALLVPGYLQFVYDIN